MSASQSPTRTALFSYADVTTVGFIFSASCRRLDPKVLRLKQQVREGVAVERPNEGGQRLAQRPAQATPRRDEAPVLGCEALHQSEIGIGGSKDLDQRYLF